MIKKKKTFYFGLSLVAIFIVWTLLVRFVDVQAIGPRNSSVGFATCNGAIHKNIGVHMFLYTLTDWLGLVPIAVAFGFAVFGLAQWIKRKRFIKVDYSLLVLGGFYIVVMEVYVLFEFVVVNYRPILIGEYLEASYPSSTTMLATCVMPTTMIQLRSRIKNTTFRRSVLLIIGAFTAFMVIGRFMSGVHWATDIVGGIFISAGLVLIYYSFIGISSLDRNECEF